MDFNYFTKINKPDGDNGDNDDNDDNDDSGDNDDNDDNDDDNRKDNYKMILDQQTFTQCCQLQLTTDPGSNYSCLTAQFTK